MLEHYSRASQDRGDGPLKKGLPYLSQPLLVSPQYQPNSKGMKYSSFILGSIQPLHNLSSLIELGQAVYRIQSIM